MRIINLPENFWCIADENTQVILPDIIYCMGICITSTSNTKIVAHYADGPGFPFKLASKDKHPIPFPLQATCESSVCLFQFLFQQLKITRAEIKEVTIFGNFKCQKELFAVSSRTVVSLQDARQFISSELALSPDKIKFNSITNANYLIHANGRVMVLPDENARIDQIDRENSKYYQSQKKQPLPLTKIQSNFQFFKSAGLYSKDDNYIDNQMQYASDYKI